MMRYTGIETCFKKLVFGIDVFIKLQSTICQEVGSKDRMINETVFCL